MNEPTPTSPDTQEATGSTGLACLPHNPYAGFQVALLHDSGFSALPYGETKACRFFLTLLVKGSQGGEAVLNGAYLRAVDEARNLVAKDALAPSDAYGRLGDTALQSASDVEVAGETVGPDAATPARLPVLEAFPEYEVHPVAMMFPRMSDESLAALAADIKSRGQLEAIVLVGNQIVDGRNRYEACRMAGVMPRTRQLEGQWDDLASLLQWALSINLHRRHLSDQQRAMIAVKAKATFEGEAEERRIANLFKKAGSAQSADRRSRAVGTAGTSTAKAAKLLNVSTRSVERAAAISKRGTPSLVAAVDEGRISLDAGQVLSGLPPKEQNETIEAGRVAATVAALRKANGKKKQAKAVASVSTPDTGSASSPSSGTQGTAPSAGLPEPLRSSVDALVAQLFGFVQELASADAKVAARTLGSLARVVECARDVLVGGDDDLLYDALNTACVTEEMLAVPVRRW